MIEDVLFEKLEFPASANFSMDLIPASSSSLRSSSGKGVISQSGVLAAHRFSTSNQPLTAAQVKHVRSLQNRAKKRCILFQSPFINKATALPTGNRFGSFTGGALIRPRGAILWQVVQYFSTSSLDKIGFRPVVYAENIKLTNDAPVSYDFITKASSLPVEVAGLGDTEIEFASFDFWLPCRISQFEAVPLRERKLSLSNSDVEYTASITLEEDPTISLPVLFSWVTAETVGGVN